MTQAKAACRVHLTGTSAAPKAGRLIEHLVARLFRRTQSVRGGTSWRSKPPSRSLAEHGIAPDVLRGYAIVAMITSTWAVPRASTRSSICRCGSRQRRLRAALGATAGVLAAGDGSKRRFHSLRALVPTRAHALRHSRVLTLTSCSCTSCLDAFGSGRESLGGWPDALLGIVTLRVQPLTT